MNKRDIFIVNEASHAQVVKIAGRNVTLCFSEVSNEKAIQNAKEILSKSYISSLLNKN